jgi:hypothetical protein
MEENAQFTESIDSVTRRNQYRLHIISIVVYVCITSYGLFSIATGHPGVGSWWVILPLFSFPPMLHHMVMMVLLKLGAHTKRKKITIPVRMITLVLGILLVGTLNHYVSAYALDRFTSGQSEFITSLPPLNAGVCDHASQYRSTPSGRFLKGLLYKNDDYLVTFHGGSIDIDGSTIYYQRSSDKWDIVHNDLLQQENSSHPLKQTISKMSACEIRIK